MSSHHRPLASSTDQRVRLASPPIIRAALAPRRFSWVMVDGEHGLITDEHYYNVGPAGLFGLVLVKDGPS